MADFGADTFAASLALLPAGEVAVADDGAPDAGFSGDGLRTVDFHDRADDANALAARGETLIVAGTATTRRRGTDFGLARLDWEGALDPTFSRNGKQTTNFRGDDEAWDVEVAPNARLIAGGWTTARGTRGDPVNSALARFLLR